MIIQCQLGPQYLTILLGFRSAYILLSHSCKLFKSFLLCGFYNYLFLLPSCISYPPSSFTQHSCAWCPSSYKIPVAAPIPASFSPIEMIEMFLLYLRTIPLLVLGFAYHSQLSTDGTPWIILLFFIQSQFQFLTSVSHQQSAFTYEWSLSHHTKEGEEERNEKEGEKFSLDSTICFSQCFSCGPRSLSISFFSTLLSLLPLNVLN